MRSRQKVLQLAAETDALADAQQHLAARLHQIAHQFVHPADTHRRADEFSKQAEVNRERARALRAVANGEQVSWSRRLRRRRPCPVIGETVPAAKEVGPRG
jgi:hypothetical protein